MLKTRLVNLFPNIPLHHKLNPTSAADLGGQLIFDAKALTIIMFAFSLRVEVNVQITMPGQRPTHSKQVHVEIKQFLEIKKQNDSLRLTLRWQNPNIQRCQYLNQFFLPPYFQTSL